jgi:hypothetical protein
MIVQFTSRSALAANVGEEDQIVVAETIDCRSNYGS